MKASILPLVEMSRSWLVYHRRWGKNAEGQGGSMLNWGFSFSHVLTDARSAWQSVPLPGTPPFYEVITEPLDGVSVNTNLQRQCHQQQRKIRKMSGRGKPAIFSDEPYYRELWLLPRLNIAMPLACHVWVYENALGWHGWQFEWRNTIETTWLKGHWQVVPSPELEELP